MPVDALYRAVAESAWSWVLGEVRGDDGPWLPVAVPATGPVPPPAGDRDSLFVGVGGLALALAEVVLSRPWTDEESALSAAVARRLAEAARTRDEPSLYFGLAGDATALRLLAPGTEVVALRRLLDLVVADGWPTTLSQLGAKVVNDLLLGTAGVVLAAVWVGGPDGDAVAAAGADGLLRVAEETPAGRDWLSIPGWHRRLPNYSHGTAGIATALAVAGRRLGRADLVDAARLGAEHLVSIADLSDEGFRLPHYVPHGDSDEEPVTYSWCHGPTGTSYLFLALADAGVDRVGGLVPADLHRRCLHATMTSGLPERLRPGFWDNDGRCCGTAGVGDTVLDAAQATHDVRLRGELLEFAAQLGDVLVERAVRDADGARWQFLEHRTDPPVLDPGTGWMHGAAGIAAFLLRLARVREQGPGTAVVDRPDQWWAVPAALRTSGPATPASR